MKSILSFFIVSFISLTAYSAPGNPIEAVTIIETKTVTVTTDALNTSLFVTAEFDENSQRFEFNTGKEIQFVQIFDNEDKLVMQLPTNSKNVKLGLSLFDKGEYKLGFIVLGQKDIQFTDVSVK
jgi:hypothetical protein